MTKEQFKAAFGFLFPTFGDNAVDRAWNDCKKLAYGGVLTAHLLAIAKIELEERDRKGAKGK